MSIFKKAENRNSVISYRLLEEIKDLSEGNEEEDLGHVLVDAWMTVIGEHPSEEELKEAAQRFNKLEEVAELDSEGANRNMKSLSTDYMWWINDMQGEQVCLWLAGYDWDVAYDLYVNRDFEDIQAMVQVKSAEEFHKVQAQFEAAMYGFGGGYEKDGSGGKVIDVSTEEGLAKMDAIMGF